MKHNQLFLFYPSIWLETALQQRGSALRVPWVFIIMCFFLSSSYGLDYDIENTETVYNFRTIPVESFVYDNSIEGDEINKRYGKLSVCDASPTWRLHLLVSELRSIDNDGSNVSFKHVNLNCNGYYEWGTFSHHIVKYPLKTWWCINATIG